MTGEWLDRITSERARQDAKWGLQDHDDGRWSLILQEELGEVAEAILNGRFDDSGKELVQAAAVIIAWLEALERRGPAR